MKKKEESQPLGAAEGGRRPTGAAPNGLGGKGRFSSQRKAEAVLRLLRGEELEPSPGNLASWRPPLQAGRRPFWLQARPA